MSSLRTGGVQTDTFRVVGGAHRLFAKYSLGNLVFQRTRSRFIAGRTKISLTRRSTQSAAPGRSHFLLPCVFPCCRENRCRSEIVPGTAGVPPARPSRTPGPSKFHARNSLRTCTAQTGGRDARDPGRYSPMIFSFPAFFPAAGKTGADLRSCPGPRASRPHALPAHPAVEIPCAKLAQNLHGTTGGRDARSPGGASRQFTRSLLFSLPQGKMVPI